MRTIFLFLTLALLVSWGCHKRSSVVAPSSTTSPASPAPTAVTPAPAIQPAPLESASIAKTVTAPSYLELAELNFQIGKYAQSIKYLEAFLSNNPKSKSRDAALFKLGLSRALINDMRLAEISFRRMISESPNSPYKAQAEIIIGLMGQIEKLRLDVKERDERIKKLGDELQVLKDIDLQRRPARAKE